VVLAGARPARREGQRGGADGKLLALRSADRAGGLDRRRVLAHHSGPRPVGADILDPEGLAGDDRQRQRAAKHLPAAFAFRTVDEDH